MSEIPENENNPAAVTESQEPAPAVKDEFDQYETIFGDPEEHHDKQPRSNKKKRLLAVIASALAVAILVGGTVAVIKLIPVKDDEAAESTPFEEIKVLELKPEELTEVNVTNAHGSFRFYSETSKADSSSAASSSDTSTATETVTWYADGLAREKTDSTSIESIVSAAATVTASRKIETKGAADCGLTKPVSRVAMTGKDGTKTAVLVGAESPDGTGTYLMLEGKEEIYLVETDSVSSFDFDLLSLAKSNDLAGIAVDKGSKYADDSGALTLFDSLTVTGKNYPVPLVITANSDTSEVAAYLPYLTTSPQKRYADQIDPLFNVFKSGIAVTGLCSLEVDSASLKKFGLDQPDMTLSMKAGGHTRTFKLSAQSDGSYAVIADESTVISKASAETITFADSKAEDYYAGYVCLRSINDLSNFTVETEGKTYSFDILYDSENEDEQYIINHNGKKLTATYFQNLYQYFVGLNTTEFESEPQNVKPEVTVTLTYTKTGRKEVIAFTKVSATKYQYSIDGQDLGRITSASLNKFVKSLKSVSAGNDVT